MKEQFTVTKNEERVQKVEKSCLDLIRKIGQKFPKFVMFSLKTLRFKDHLRHSIPALLMALMFSATVTSSAETIQQLQPGDSVPDFSLMDHQGRMHTLSRQTESKAIALFVHGNGCPIVRQSISKLNDLQREFGKQGIVFALLNASTQDPVEEIAEEAKEYGIRMPVLKDDTQWVARTLGLTRTAEILLIESGTWKLLYRGGIDDQLIYGGRQPEVKRTFFKDALNQFLSGKAIEQPVAPFKGCKLFYSAVEDEVEGAEISYSNTIAPLLVDRCLGCHQPGQIGPFSMSRYSKVRGWSEMIREVVLTHRMPPWHADPHYGTFSNDRSLSVIEKQQLLSWIDQGCPRGEGPDPLEEAYLAARNSAEGRTDWELGNPDFVLEMKQPQTIAANGIFPYVHEVLISPIQEDVWLKGVDILPGNRSVLHHCLVFIKYPKGSGYEKENNEGGLKGCFAGYVPGYSPRFYPEGSGKFIPKGSKFVIQLHYTATGKPEVDDTKIGLYVADQRPELELKTKSAFNTEISIPPGAKNYRTAGEFVFKKDSRLFELNPHMHYRGSWFRYTLIHPDQSSSILLSTPNYDFNWQTTYRLADPIDIPAGSILRCEGGFDNSSQNPFNPDPTQTVVFGEQTFDEMFIGYFSFAEKTDSDLANSGAENGNRSE